MIYTKDNPYIIHSIFNIYILEDNKPFTGVAKDKDNRIAYYLNGKLHRIDGPAVIYTDGYERWYLNGKCHREDGPAVKSFNSYKEWHLNGEYYGWYDDFTNESWIRFVKLELLK